MVGWRRGSPALVVLSGAQALYWSCSIIGIALTGLVGQRMAPVPWLATLPLTLVVVGNLSAIGPVSRWMAQHGRAAGLCRGAGLGMVSGGLAVAALYSDSFALLCVAMLLLGGYQASSGFYRFAVLDGVAPAQRGRAAALVVAGGIVAALLAPGLALWAQSQLSVPQAGAYAAVVVLAGAAALLLRTLPASAPERLGVVGAEAAPASAPVSPPLSPQAWRSLRRQLLQRPGVRRALVLGAPVGTG